MTYRSDLEAAIRAGKEKREAAQRFAAFWESLRHGQGLAILVEAAEQLRAAGYEDATAGNRDKYLFLKCGEHELSFVAVPDGPYIFGYLEEDQVEIHHATIKEIGGAVAALEKEAVKFCHRVTALF